MQLFLIKNKEYTLLFQGQASSIEYNSGTSAEGLHSKSKVNRLPFFYQVLIMLYYEMLLNCLALLFYLENLDFFFNTVQQWESNP